MTPPALSINPPSSLVPAQNVSGRKPALHLATASGFISSLSSQAQILPQGSTRLQQSTLHHPLSLSRPDSPKTGKDYELQRPSQELTAKDLHGNEWKFRHIYRGQPRRHLLTTGWSTFVIVSGDAVHFLRFTVMGQF